VAVSIIIRPVEWEVTVHTMILMANTCMDGELTIPATFHKEMNMRGGINTTLNASLSANDGSGRRGLHNRVGERQSPTRSGQVHVFEQRPCQISNRSRRKTDQTPDSAVLLLNRVARIGTGIVWSATCGRAASRISRIGMRFGRRATLLSGVLGIVVSLWGAAAEAQLENANLTATGSDAYSITLNNTGNSTIGTFWYSWVPGKDFMSVAPTNVTSPAGWTSNITHGGSSDGYAIQWTAISPADDLVLGNSLSGFSFDSTLSASQLTIDDSPLYPTMPVGTSYTYTGSPFSSAGDLFTVNPVPEASTIVLAAVSACVWLAGRGWRRRL
jgi:hypothetical protein